MEVAVVLVVAATSWLPVGAGHDGCSTSKERPAERREPAATSQCRPREVMNGPWPLPSESNERRRREELGENTHGRTYEVDVLLAV